MNWQTRSASGVILLFLFVALVAPFISSPYPLLVYRNNSDLKVPLSPFFSSFQKKEEARLSRIDFRALAEKEDIGALFTLVPYSPYEQNLDQILYPPSFGRFGNYLGTDEVGRDIAARMVHGAKNSMMVGMVAVMISLLFGVAIGATAGYFGGWVDLLLSRFIEIVITFPTLILILAVLAILQPSLTKVMVVIGLTGWTGIARVIRGEVLKRKNFEYVMAAKISGASHLRTLAVHILPNSLAPVMVMASFQMADVVLLESSLSFLGIGVRAPEPSWGQILNIAKSYLDFAWWLVMFPGISIFLTVVSYNLLGEFLRDKLNPKERKG